MAGNLIEDQRQGERDFLVLKAGVPVQDGLAAEVRGGLLHDLPVGAELLVVRHCFPRVGRVRTPGGSGLDSLTRPGGGRQSRYGWWRTMPNLATPLENVALPGAG